MDQGKAEDHIGGIAIDAEVVEVSRNQPVEQGGDHRAIPVPGATNDGQREDHHRFSRRKGTGIKKLEVAGEKCAGHTGKNAGQREAPDLVEGHINPRCHGGGLALADQGPAAASTASLVPIDQQEAERHHQHAIAEIGAIRFCEKRARHVGNGLDGKTGQAAAAVWKLQDVDQDSEPAGGHQRYQSQIEAAHAQGRIGEHHADHSGKQAPCNEVQFERQAEAMGKAQGDPAAAAHQRHLRKGYQPKPSIQQRDAGGGQRIDCSAGQHLHPERIGGEGHDNGHRNKKHLRRVSLQ